MIKKIITGCLVLATSSLFGMSLDQLNSASKAELIKINIGTCMSHFIR